MDALSRALGGEDTLNSLRVSVTLQPTNGDVTQPTNFSFYSPIPTVTMK
jgi:hypothetical protein